MLKRLCRALSTALFWISWDHLALKLLLLSLDDEYDDVSIELDNDPPDPGPSVVFEDHEAVSELETRPELWDIAVPSDPYSVN